MTGMVASGRRYCGGGGVVWRYFESASVGQIGWMIIVICLILGISSPLYADPWPPLPDKWGGVLPSIDPKDSYIDGAWVNHLNGVLSYSGNLKETQPFFFDFLNGNLSGRFENGQISYLSWFVMYQSGKFHYYNPWFFYRNMKYVIPFVSVSDPSRQRRSIDFYQRLVGIEEVSSDSKIISSVSNKNIFLKYARLIRLFDKPTPDAWSRLFYYPYDGPIYGTGQKAQPRSCDKNACLSFWALADHPAAIQLLFDGTVLIFYNTGQIIRINSNLDRTDYIDSQANLLWITGENKSISEALWELDSGYVLLDDPNGVMSKDIYQKASQDDSTGCTHMDNYRGILKLAIAQGQGEKARAWFSKIKCADADNPRP